MSVMAHKVSFCHPAHVEIPQKREQTMLSNKEKELLLKLLLEKAEKPLEVQATNTIVKQIKRAKRVHRHPIRYWSDEEKKQILELHNAGFSDREIAKEFNARSHQIHMVRINYTKKLSGVKW